MKKRPGLRGEGLVFLICASIFALATQSCQSGDSLVAKGQAFQAEKKYQDAEIQFRRAIQKSPDLPQAHYSLAKVLVEQGKRPEALASFSRAFELDPKSPDIQNDFTNYLIAEYISNRRRPQTLYSQIAQLSTKLLQSDPRSRAGRKLKGVIALSDAQYAQAIEELSAAGGSDFSDREAALMLIEAHYLSGDKSEAETLLQRMLEKNPKDQGAYARLYSILVESKNLEEAGRLLEKQSAANPGNSSVALRLAMHRSVYQANREGGQKLISEIVENRQTYPDGALTVARFYMQTGNYASAIPILEKAVQGQGPNALDSHRSLIECLWQAGRLTEASQRIAEAKKLFPKEASIDFADAIVHIERKNAGEAQEALEILERLRSGGFADSQLEFHRARAQMIVGRVDEGIKTLQEMSRMQRGNLTSRYALIAHYIDTQQLGDALLLLDEIDRIIPNSERAALLRMQVLRRGGRLEEARNILQQAKINNPDSNRIMEEQGIQALIMKRGEEARTVFKQLYDKGFRPGPVIAGLLEAYSMQGQFANAQALLDAEKRANPQNKVLKALQAELFAKQNKLTEAIQEMEEINRSQPKADSMILRRLSALYIRAGKPANAVQVYRVLKQQNQLMASDYPGWLEASVEASDIKEIESVCRDLEPEFEKNWTSANNCAFAYADAGGDPVRAEAWTRASLYRNQNQPNLRDTLSWVQIKQGKYNEALATLDMLVRENPRNASFHYHRGVALAGLRRMDDAKAAYKTSLAANPSPSLAARVRKAIADAR